LFTPLCLSNQAE